MHGSIVDRFLRDVRNATVQIVPVRGDAGAATTTRWAGDADEAANQAAARLRRLRAGARRARRVERAHAQPDERGVRPDHRRELRLGGRRPGHEGEPRAAGLGGAVRSARPARPRARGRSPSIARDSTPRSTRPRPTSPRPASPRSIDAIRRGRDEYYRRFDAFLERLRRPDARATSESLEPQFNAVRAECDRLLRLNQEAMRRKADAASRIARRWFFVTLALALGLMAAGVARRSSACRTRFVGPVRQLTAATTRLAAGDLDAAVPVAVGRRDRRARRRLQPDGRADPRAAPIGPGQAARRAADDRGGDRFAVRPGDRHRRRRAA